MSDIIAKHDITSSRIVTESNQYSKTKTTVTSSGGYSRTEIHSSSTANPRTALTSQGLLTSNFDRGADARLSLPIHRQYALPQLPSSSSLNTGLPSVHPATNSKVLNHFYSPSSVPRPAMSGVPLGTYPSRSKNSPLLATTQDEKPKPQKKSRSWLSVFSKDSGQNGFKNEDKKPVAVIDAKMIPVPNIPNNTYLVNTFVNDMEKKLVINVHKTRKIYPLEVDKIPTYETKSKYIRGRVLLINNIAFPNSKYREGAQVDHANISKLFKDMGFRIEDYKDMKKQKMKTTIENYCRKSFLKEADISIVIIMSHGNGNNDTYIETVDRHVLEAEWIVDQFSNKNCPHLANKPKIFIFQCCRGEGRDVQIDSIPFQVPRSHSDTLLAFATVPGQVSHRDPKLGTWYIQSICKIFMEHAYDTDVESLLKLVDNNLKMNYTHHRQTSAYENRGFKRCFLNPI